MLTSSSDSDDTIRSLKRKQRTDDLSRSSKNNDRSDLSRILTKNKGICSGRGETTGQISGGLLWDENQDICSELSEEVASKLSNSVVSIALSDGDTLLCECSGITVKREGSLTRFITSASLVRACNNKREDNLRLEVCHEDYVAKGFLRAYDLDREIAFVDVMTFRDIQAIYPNAVMNFEPQRMSKVVAVGRDISGKLMTMGGILNGYSAKPKRSKRFIMSTCKIPEVCEGGPLFDFDGNFLGMNVYGVQWEPFSCQKIQLVFFYRKPGVGKGITVHRNTLTEDLLMELEFFGYPKPSESMLNVGMILVETFEDPFGDEYGKGVWSELSKTVSSNIYEATVALASFNGEKRFFACTGIFIEWNGCTPILTSGSLVRSSRCNNKIDENLTIEVLLPNNKRAEGTLQSYNLHYNVALVSVNGFRASQTIKLERRYPGSFEVLSVGRCFKSGSVMAARGSVIARPSTLDCRVGIGGPLLDFDGKFIGMNFYEKVLGTPFMTLHDLLKILESFKRERTVADTGRDYSRISVLDWTMDGDCKTSINSWPVPAPYWCHPEDVNKRKLIGLYMYVGGEEYYV
ncbi:hypothetical protein ACP70R_039028 [Stipagrostis hirtigluma subsp. patula]